MVGLFEPKTSYLGQLVTALLETYISLACRDVLKCDTQTGSGELAQLDPLLTALVDRQAEALLLTEGQRPAFRTTDGLRPVSQKNLDRNQITKLMAELSDSIGLAQLTDGQPVNFHYSLPDGRQFSCEIVLGTGGLQARVAPHVAQSDESTIAISPEPVAEAPQEAPAETQAEVATAEQTVPTVTPPAVQPVTGDGPPIEALLRQMCDVGASDLHISSAENPMFRVDGEMVLVEGASPLSAEEIHVLLDPIVPERNREEYKDCHDTDFAHEIPGVARYRANLFADRKGPGAVFRVIPSKILTADQLGLPPAVRGLCQLSKGLVLVTGPTGSGKSTTLAAMVDLINKERREHIITIEDPVEFVHENQLCLVNQREVKTHTDSFKKALRAALREDPDIVLVGEMRDLETIAIAIETAETGHLVFGTLHTTTAVSTVDRIIDQFPSDTQAQIRTMLSESVKGVVSQTLLNKIGGGRVAALEILIVTPAISNLIREAKTFQIPSLMQTGKLLGMVLLNDSLLKLVKDKVVEPAEAYHKAIEKKGLLAGFKAAGISFDPGAKKTEAPKLSDPDQPV
jgi:twitching motility protein PilT